MTSHRLQSLPGPIPTALPSWDRARSRGSSALIMQPWILAVMGYYGKCNVPISGRGFNLFKLLRRHFRATMIPATIGSDVSSETVAREATTQFGKKFVELGSDPTFIGFRAFRCRRPAFGPIPNAARPQSAPIAPQGFERVQRFAPGFTMQLCEGVIMAKLVSR